MIFSPPSPSPPPNLFFRWWGGIFSLSLSSYYPWGLKFPSSHSLCCPTPLSVSLCPSPYDPWVLNFCVWERALSLSFCLPHPPYYPWILKFVRLSSLSLCVFHGVLSVQGLKWGYHSNSYNCLIVLKTVLILLIHFATLELAKHWVGTVTSFAANVWPQNCLQMASATLHNTITLMVSSLCVESQVARN